MVTYVDVPFSELLHHPAATADRLKSAWALRLRRRDADDLALMRVQQMEQDQSVMELATRLLVGLMRSENIELVRRLLADALPWVAFLPDPDADAFLAELVTVAHGAVDLGNLSPVAVLITQWRHSAEIHADPALREHVAREPDGDFGPAPAPMTSE